MFFTIVESTISPCSPQEFMRTIAPRRLAKLPVRTEIGCASLGLLPSHGPTGNYPVVLEESAYRQVQKYRSGGRTCRKPRFSGTSRRPLRWAKFPSPQRHGRSFEK